MDTYKSSTDTLLKQGARFRPAHSLSPKRPVLPVDPEGEAPEPPDPLLPDDEMPADISLPELDSLFDPPLPGDHPPAEPGSPIDDPLGGVDAPAAPEEDSNVGRQPGDDTPADTGFDVTNPRKKN